MRVSLDHCKYYQLPLLSVKDYIAEFKKRFEVWLPEDAIRRYIKTGVIDHVYDRENNRYYVVIESKSMELLPLPRGCKYKTRLKTGGRLVWRKSQ